MTELKRTLSYKAIFLITINSIMGSGMFFLPAIGASVAGPSSLISWILLAIISIYASACFGELVGLYPNSGGVYEFSKKAFGDFISFMMGWLAWLIGNITTAMLVVGAVTYLLPQTNPMMTFLKIGASILWILILNYLTYRGVKTSALMLITFSFITLGLIFFLIFIGLVDPSSILSGHIVTNIHFSNLIPFFPTSNLLGNFMMIIVGVFLISEAFFGIESVCFLAGETKNPEKTLPKALLIATIFIAILTFFFVLVSLLVVPWKTFSGIDQLTGTAATIFGSTVQAPFAYYAWLLLGVKGMTIVKLWTYLVIIGSAAGFIVTSPRLILSLAEDKLFPPQLGDIHKRFFTPYKAIFFQTLVTIIFVLLAFLFGDQGYSVLLELLVPMVLLMMMVVVIIVPIMRKKDVRPRPFNVWFPKTGPYILSLVYFLLIMIWFFRDPVSSWHVLRIALSFIFVGIPIFFLLMFYYNPDAIILFMDQFAFVHLLFENINLPNKIRKEIVYSLPELKGKKILDFGAGVGTLSQHLIKELGEEGHLVAVDMSKKSLKILEKRLQKDSHKNFTIIHDPHQISRVHPDVPFVDIVVSVGMLSYIQDLNKILSELHRLLPIDGAICFVEFIDFFWLFPNAGWLKDEEKLLEMFQNNGFRVELVKIKGLFWKYLFIYGKKTKYKNNVFI